MVCCTAVLLCCSAAAGLAGNVFRIKPPMCWTKADVDFTIAVLDQALSEL
jgi:4-aminobutyrate aminotransferase-like enzyme